MFTSSDGLFRLEWSFVGGVAVLTMSGRASGWISVGFNADPVMTGADYYVGWLDPASGNAIVYDAFSTGEVQPMPDGFYSGGSDDVFDVSGSLVDGILSITFKRPVLSSDAYDADLSQSLSLLWGLGPDPGVTITRRDDSEHSDRKRAVNIVFGKHTTYGVAQANLALGLVAGGASSALNPGQLLLLVCGASMLLAVVVRLGRLLLQTGVSCANRVHVKSSRSRLARSSSELLELSKMGSSTALRPKALADNRREDPVKVADDVTTAAGTSDTPEPVAPATAVNDISQPTSTDKPMKPRIHIKKMGTFRPRFTWSRVSAPDVLLSDLSTVDLSSTSLGAGLDQDRKKTATAAVTAGPDDLSKDNYPAATDNEAGSDRASIMSAFSVSSLRQSVATILGRRLPWTDLSVAFALLGVLLVCANIIAVVWGSAPTLARTLGA